jgi:prophage antirepressor-like protein
MNKLIPFQYDSRKIRIIQDDDGEPLWIAQDICNTLNLDDVSKAMERLDDDEKLIRKLFVSGQKRNVWIINEPGLYSLIGRSNKPEAKKFMRWVRHEVLPTIRKTGKFEVGTLSELDLIIQSAKALKAIEQKQIEHCGRLSVLEAKANQNSGHTGYWTITAWCKLNTLSLSLEQAMSYGREATKTSRQWGVDISKVHDERFGVVNSYREDVLEEVFSNSAQSVQV